MNGTTERPVATTDDPADVIVLAGGLSHERDVSLRSGRRVAQALRDVGHHVIESDMNAGVTELLQAHPDAVVVPMLHGGVGEDGALREVLQVLGTRFVGSSASACRVTFDKSVATPVVRRAGVRAPRQVVLPHDVVRELGAGPVLRALATSLGFPLVVKPTRSGSALGVTKVESAEELPAAMVAAYAYGPVAVVEPFIAGTELAIAILGDEEPQVLPPVEIRPDSGVYDYTSRYTAGATRFVTPAELADEVAEACSALALSARAALGLSGICRIDIIVDEHGQPWFLEGTAAPGMTETSLVPLAMSAAGLDLGHAMSALVRDATA